MEDILDHLTDDPRLDQYVIEVVFESAWDESLRPKMFTSGSLLRLLIHTSCPDLPDTFTILDLSLAVKRLILAGSWYDPDNPHMILWPEEYQHVLERAISDIGDLHRTLLPHLMDSPDPEIQFTGIMPENSMFVVKVAGATPTRRKNTWRRIPIPGSHYDRYVVAPGLRRILSLDKKTPTRCVAFSFRNVIMRVRRYIHANRHRLIDPKEPEIIDVRNDPLGAVFGVQAFTRIQTSKLILPCLALVNNEEAWSLEYIHTYGHVLCLKGAHH
jgi:hypothetical protein